MADSLAYKLINNKHRYDSAHLISTDRPDAPLDELQRLRANRLKSPSTTAEANQTAPPSLPRQMPRQQSDIILELPPAADAKSDQANDISLTPTNRSIEKRSTMSPFATSSTVGDDDTYAQDLDRHSADTMTHEHPAADIDLEDFKPFTDADLKEVDTSTSLGDYLASNIPHLSASPFGSHEDLTASQSPLFLDDPAGEADDLFSRYIVLIQLDAGDYYIYKTALRLTTTSVTSAPTLPISLTTAMNRLQLFCHRRRQCRRSDHCQHMQLNNLAELRPKSRIQL